MIDAISHMEPSLFSELRRSLSLYNLTVAGLVGAASGLFVYVLCATRMLPGSEAFDGEPLAIAVGILGFLSVASIHSAMHAYFGWRFGRGLRASLSGDTRLAARLLAPVERVGLDHYDPTGSARRALEACRAQEVQS
jgi:hypothetical protein